MSTSALKRCIPAMITLFAGTMLALTLANVLTAGKDPEKNAATLMSAKQIQTIVTGEANAQTQ
jgi:hypothetical protein